MAAVDGGVPGVVGLLSFLRDKRAGTAAISYFPGGLILDFEMLKQKKSLLTQALKFGCLGPYNQALRFSEFMQLTFCV